MKKLILALILTACTVSGGSRQALVGEIDAHDCQIDAAPDACNSTIIDSAEAPPDSSPDATVDAPVDAAPVIDAAPINGRKLKLYLHGLGSSGPGLAILWHLPAPVNGEIVTPTEVILLPTGSPNAAGKNSWFASLACCKADLPQPWPNDDALLVNLVTAKMAQYNVDPRYVSVAGDSNGAIMGWRLACNHPDIFSAVGLVSGAANSPNDPACSSINQAYHVNFLSVHGTDDPVFPPYSPAKVDAAYPDFALPILGEAGDWVATQGTMLPGEWRQLANFNGCTGGIVGDGQFVYDLDTAYRGNNAWRAETNTAHYAGCPLNGQVDIFEMVGSPHNMVWSAQWPTLLANWLDSHHR